MNVRLFGILAEKAGTGSIEMNAGSTHALIEELRSHIKDLSDHRFSIAVDRRIVHGDVELTGQEEIAVLPPFAGG